MTEKLYLLGTKGSKRKEFFEKAAGECQVPVEFIDWTEAERADLSGGVVKIDPPSYTTSDLWQMNGQVSAYRSRLRGLENRGCVFSVS